MRHALMTSVAAAALIAAAGLASAQGVGQGGTKGSESPAAARETATPMTAPPAVNGSPALEKTAPGAASKGAAVDAKPDAKSKPQVVQEKATPSVGVGSKGAAVDEKPDAKSKPQVVQDKAGNTGTTAQGKPDVKATGEMKADGKPAASESMTTGKAPATAMAAPPAEKQTQIVSAIKQVKVEEVTNVNFNISIGTVVPSTVRYHALPPRIVEIYPEWLGYEFILVHGRYVILRPRTHEIVYIIEG